VLHRKPKSLVSVGWRRASVRVRLDYANSLLYGISKSNLNKLQRVLNSLSRIVLNCHHLASSNGLLSQLHWLPIHHRINFILATITFKALSSQQPSHLYSLLHPYVSISTHTLRSSSHQLLTIPRCRTEFGKRAFSNSAPSVWNTIPVEIRSSSSLVSFKRSLKSYLFTQP